MYFFSSSLAPTSGQKISSPSGRVRTLALTIFCGNTYPRRTGWMGAMWRPEISMQRLSAAHSNAAELCAVHWEWPLLPEASSHLQSGVHGSFAASRWLKPYGSQRGIPYASRKRRFWICWEAAWMLVSLPMVSVANNEERSSSPSRKACRLENR